MKSWKKPTNELIERTLGSLKTEVDRQYFFSKLRNPLWIEPLKKSGHFEHAPAAKPLPDGYVNYPFWPEFLFLMNVASEEPEQVIEIIEKIPKTNNPRFYEDVIEIALKVEASLSTRLKAKIIEYLKGQYPFWYPHFEKLLDYWISNCQIEAALELIKALIEFHEDPHATDKENRRKTDLEGYTTILEPRPRFNEGVYKKIMEEGVRSLSEKAPLRTAQILIKTATNMIYRTFHTDQLEQVGNNDFSMYWCQRVNEPTNDYPDSKECLVHTLTFACEKVFELEPDSTSELDKTLRKQRWDIFTRIRQHLYARQINEQTIPWIREMVLEHKDYGRWEHHFEFQQMIRLASDTLSTDFLTEPNRKWIFDTILSGPSEEDFRDWMGNDFTDELFRKRKKRFHTMQLRPFATVLFGKYTDKYQELESEESQSITDDDYAPYRSGNAGIVQFRSPRSVDDLERLSDEELLSFLNQWDHVQHDLDDWSVEINFEQLALTFQSVFTNQILPDETRLRYWFENRDAIERPIYVRAIVSAIHEQMKLRQLDRFKDWLNFCEWALLHEEKPKEEGVISSDASKDNPDWHRTRRAVGDFVETCVEKDSTIPASHRQSLANLLDTLCTEYDRQLDENERTLLNQDNSVIEAVNNTRSRALKSLVDFGYWVRRQTKNSQADTPEVFEILEKRFGKESEYTLQLPEYVILGIHYHRIFGLDREWAIKHKNDFFPRDDEVEVWKKAFWSFIKFNSPVTEMFDVIREDLLFALDNIDQLETGENEWNRAVENLGLHLFSYFLWDKFPLLGEGLE